MQMANLACEIRLVQTLYRELVACPLTCPMPVTIEIRYGKVHNYENGSAWVSYSFIVGDGAGTK
jgi:hypothetical protein